MLDVVHNRARKRQRSRSCFVCDFLALLRHAEGRDSSSVFQNDRVAARACCCHQTHRRHQPRSPNFPTSLHPLNLPHHCVSIEATLPLYAQSQYTTSMSLRAFTFSLAILLCAVSLTAQQAPLREPRELLAALNRVQLDS